MNRESTGSRECVSIVRAQGRNAKYTGGLGSAQEEYLESARKEQGVIGGSRECTGGVYGYYRGPIQ